MNLIEQRDIIQDAIDGHPIQLKKIDDHKAEWQDARPRAFSFGLYLYRRKPEPREWCLHEHIGSGEVTGVPAEEVRAGLLSDRHYNITGREVL